MLTFNASRLGIIFLLMSQVSYATVFFDNVNSDALLRSAIISINTSPGTAPTAGSYQINITGSFAISGSDMPVLQNGATINGNGFTISGANSFRLFATSNSDLTIQNLTLDQGLAQGGTGGGGGLGAGGGVYIDKGRTLTLTNTTISNCNANGGSSGVNGGGGGASFSVTDKNAPSSGNGGGNGGGTGIGISVGGGGGSGDNSGNGYGGGNGGHGFGYFGGSGGGSGSGSNADNIGSGANGGYCGGGGGGGWGGGGGGNGGGHGANSYGGGGSGGGGGGLGGGGGSGGGGDGSGSNPRCGGGGGGFGGGGGYGGGGGGGGGGFGGGGGGFGVGSGFSYTSSNGGSFGGSGLIGVAGGGGGGGGLGGGVFVADGATLAISDEITFTNNNVAGGAGSTGSNGGYGYAKDVFLFQGAKISFNGANDASMSFAIQADIPNSYSGNLGAPAGHLDAGVIVSLTNANSTVTLSSTSNTYQGGTFLNSGILSISDDTNLGTVPSPAATNITFNGGTLATSANFSINTNRNISLGVSGGTIAVGSGFTTTYAGIISGASGGTFTASGLGTLVLGGANTFTGSTTISNGTVSISTDANLGNTANALTLNNGTLATTASFTLNSGRTTALGSGGGTLAINSGNVTYSGNITGNVSGALTKTGASTLILGAANSFVGPVNITVGAIQANIANVIANSTALNLANTAGVAFNLNNFNQTIGSLSGGGGTGGNISLGSATLTVNQTAAGVFSGNITGTGGLILSGSSTNSLTLSGTNTYNGTTTVTGGTLIFSGVTNASAVVNNSIFNINGASSTSADITNAGTMSINALLTSTGNIINNNILSLAGDINMAGHTFTNNGTTTISGTRTVTATTYTSTGTQNITITNDTTYDNLTVTGDVVLDSSNVTISSNFAGDFNAPVITGGTLSHVGTIVTVPTSSSIFSVWDYNFTPTQLFITSAFAGFQFSAYPGFNTKVAAVLDAINANITNSGQQILIDAFLSYTTVEAYNSGLQQLIPNLNASAPDVMLQDYVFNRIESRIAAVTNPNTGMSGMAAGDLNPTTAMWIGGFGSIARQQAIGENPGYDSNSFGVIVGFDKLMRNNGVFGFGLAFSRNLVKEKSNVNFATGIDGYHAVLYENYYFKCDKFLEALATAALTNSSGSRAININGTIMSTSSNYNGGQGAVRLNYGKNFDFADIFSIAPLATIQYSLLYAPDYNETYSPAALHVSPTNYQDILTMGGGVRLSVPANEWWLLGSREFRALVTYDAISSDNLTTANFLVGSPNFAVSTSPKRLALKLGVDFAFNIMRCTQIAFEYDYELRHKYTDHSGTLKIRYLF